MLIRKVGGRRAGGQLLPGGGATVITSNDTFVAGAAGVYRVLCVGSGGCAHVAASGDRPGGGSGFLVYGEVTLTAAQNVTVTIGASQGGDLLSGNPTSFGSYFQAPGGGPAVSTSRGGDGFSGGGVGNGGTNGGTNGSNGAGTGTPGKGQGGSILAFVAGRFADATIGAGTNGSTDAGGGVTINSSGNYGRGEQGASIHSGSTAGACVVEGPYSA